jgi:hypothetical protein
MRLKPASSLERDEALVRHVLGEAEMLLRESSGGERVLDV